MKYINPLPCLLLSLLCLSANANEIKTQRILTELQPYVHSGQVFPPILLLANFDPEALKSDLSGFKAFQDIDLDTPGRPLRLRVLRAVIESPDDDMESTVLKTSAATSGSPVLTKKVFRVRYDVFVRNDSVAKFEYDLQDTAAANIRSDASDQPISAEQQIFMNHTMQVFLHDLVKSSDVQAYFSEYFEYYGQ